MSNTNIFTIIDNMIDELERTENLLSYEDTEMTYGEVGVRLLKDIRTNLSKVRDIKERIEFAIIIAVYMGERNDNGEDFDFSSWRKKIIEIASNIEFSYTNDGKIASDAMFNIADEMVTKLLKHGYVE